MIQENLDTYVTFADTQTGGAGLPKFVTVEFDAYLACGILDYGFSLHVVLRVAADDRLGLEQLCREITRPAIADERLSVNLAGQVMLKLKTVWRDDTSHHVTAPLEFMQHLAARVLRPRLHLICFHGVLAPNATLRKAVVPAPAPPPLVVVTPAQDGDGA